MHPGQSRAVQVRLSPAMGRTGPARPQPGPPLLTRRAKLSTGVRLRLSPAVAQTGSSWPQSGPAVGDLMGETPWPLGSRPPTPCACAHHTKSSDYVQLSAFSMGGLTRGSACPQDAEDVRLPGPTPTCDKGETSQRLQSAHGSRSRWTTHSTLEEKPAWYISQSVPGQPRQLSAGSEVTPERGTAPAAAAPVRPPGSAAPACRTRRRCRRPRSAPPAGHPWRQLQQHRLGPGCRGCSWAAALPRMPSECLQRRERII